MMAKKSRYSEPPSEKEREAFSRYLSEDEELIVATGFGRHYLRQLFIIRIMLPGFIFILGGFAAAYFLKFTSPEYGLLIGFIASLFFAGILNWWTYNSNRYLLTTRRVIIKKGLITVKLTSALFDKITHIEVDQGFIDRVFLRHGRIIIHTAGSEKDELVMRYVESPIEFKNLLERSINRERELHGRGASPLVAVEGELIE